ncbi:hypothetical protein AB0O22_12680 [Streptomyces sp. NPDC091204]|uniref:helix-turn-helix transcriptional regulator n=1 Tax=Streptomyces sp. NPDC091204 TaxID=3155299 RepID=UPI00342597B4
MSRIPTPVPFRAGPDWMTARQVADVTSYALQTLKNQRNLGIGLPYIKLPTGRIWYRRADVEALISEAAAA